ncbi:MAG: 23S rRNA (pseudouridine(1915)-N(3))-methyltransferase RlmH [Chthoniobacterales bacterium]|jgi:23S rRNA (pseudouridine1915-N3)-methyltransferase
MKWLILTVGKSALPYAKAGRDEYLERLAHFAPVAKVTVKASNPARESAGLLELSEGCFRVVLHERGTAPTSRELAAKVDQWRQSGRRVAVIIGGADGHDQSLLDAADFLWSLGPLTLQHELALVVALEQLYRAHTILSGHPYHRD